MEVFCHSILTMHHACSVTQFNFHVFSYFFEGLTLANLCGVDTNFSLSKNLQDKLRQENFSNSIP